MSVEVNERSNQLVVSITNEQHATTDEILQFQVELIYNALHGRKSVIIGYDPNKKLELDVSAFNTTEVCKTVKRPNCSVQHYTAVGPVSWPEAFIKKAIYQGEFANGFLWFYVAKKDGAVIDPEHLAENVFKEVAMMPEKYPDDECLGCVNGKLIWNGVSNCELNNFFVERFVDIADAYGIYVDVKLS